MSFTNRVLVNASRLFPKSVKAKMKELLTYGGVKKSVNDYLGISLITSMLLSTTALIFRQFPLSLLLGAGIFFGVLATFLLYPYFMTTKRASTVNANLPDFLNLMSANLRSGMSPIQAMLGAAKKDFGILSEEIKDLVSASMGTGSYEEIFKSLLKRIRSEELSRISRLLSSGMKTGGNLSSLLEGAAEEMNRLSVLKRKLTIAVRSQMIFITIIIIAGLPFLLTVSTQFVQTIQVLQSFTNPSQIAPNIYNSNISLEYLQEMSYIILTATSLFASFLIGSVIDNSFVQGLKYFLPLLALSLITYVIAINVVPNIIGSINLT